MSEESWLPVFLGLVLTGFAMLIPVRDAPDGARKTQARAVPRTGGLAIGVATLVSFWFIADVDDHGASMAAALAVDLPLAALLGFILVCAVTGFIDDLVNLPALLKTGILGAAALATAIAAPVVAFPLPGAEDLRLPLTLGIAGTALWLFIFVNAANFMDGSNGLAGGSLLIMALCFSLVIDLSGGWFAQRQLELISLAGFTLGFATLGFLAWNLTGRIYLGDAGSLGLGAVVAVLGLITAVRISVWVPAILSLPLLVDVLLTLIWRARHGAKLTEGHRDHAYQLLLRSGWRHWQVAILWWAFMLACALSAWLAMWLDYREWPRLPGFAMVAFVFLALLGAMLWNWQRRWLWPRLSSPDQP
jgi:UDP-GlcNAc:undecaprenyl-phosphate/decaprenyl-phosphate GlcNAc-1-phosphate transferase